MKDLLNTLCTASTLKLLVCEDLKYEFPLKYPNEKEDKRKMKMRSSDILANVIKGTPWGIKQSFDQRFDKKHIIELAIQGYLDKGFTAKQVYTILHNKTAVKRNKILGPLKFLSNFITETHRLEIEAKLKEVTFENGAFRRNGILF